MKFYEFIEFLQTGKVAPIEVLQSNLLENQENALNANQISSIDDETNIKAKILHSKSLNNLQTSNNIINDNINTNERPPVPPSHNTNIQRKQMGSNDSMLTPGYSASNLINENIIRNNVEMNTMNALVPSKGLHIVSISAGESPSSQSTALGGVKALWKKREVTKQERIIQYTTVDATGTVQVHIWPL
jgi:hypothetical protein